MIAPKIILIWEHALLRDMVKALLRQAGAEPLADFDSQVSIEKIQAYTPSHVLVEAASTKHRDLIASLLEQDEITIIRLNLTDNQLQVIQRQDHTIAHSSDLLNWLQDQSTTTS